MATVAVTVVVRRSRLGLQLLAIRDDEDRALGLGVRTGRVKLFAFTLSAIPIGMIGAVYAYFLGQIFPQFAFDPLFDITIALMAFFGGLATIVGPLLGALVLESMQQELTLRFSAGGGIYLIVYGALFLAVILVMPRGVVPTLRDALENARARRMDSRGVRMQTPLRSRP
jgi:branched-chain amino acid transport system permease protein